VLKISYQGNLDLYFSLYHQNPNDLSFIINKDNFQVFSFFEKLYNRVINRKVYSEEIDDNEIFEFEEESKGNRTEFWELYEEKLKEKIKDNRLLLKYAKSKNLINNGVITWLSDEYPDEDAPAFVIEKADEDTIKITFRPPIDSINTRYMGNEYYISIRISNSGSRYNNFGKIFMEFFRSLCGIPNDYHQMHLEEYIYEKKQSKKR